ESGDDTPRGPTPDLCLWPPDGVARPLADRPSGRDPGPHWSEWGRQDDPSPSLGALVTTAYGDRAAGRSGHLAAASTGGGSPPGPGAPKRRSIVAGDR